MITKKQVFDIQHKWCNAIIKIGQLKDNREACEKITDEILDDLYAFENGPVLFKPTKVSLHQFRPTKESAKSYFIGGNEQFPEDAGFALQPWEKIHFENHNILFEENRAIAMGNYFFSDQSGIEKKVEFTFGYSLDQKGELKIDLHHSSIPYNIL